MSLEEQLLFLDYCLLGPGNLGKRQVSVDWAVCYRTSQVVARTG